MTHPINCAILEIDQNVGQQIGSGPGQPCLGSRFPFGPKHARWRIGSSLLAGQSITPEPVVLEKQSCDVRGIVPDMHKVSSKKPVAQGSMVTSCDIA